MVMIIAHRGASDAAPENTLAAFQLAWKAGADGIEGDFHATADGHIICIHDRRTKRVAGADRVIAESQLQDLLTLDVGSWKERQWATERIPTLPQVLAVVPAGKRLYLEIKGGAAMVAPMAEALEASTLSPDQTVLISFDEAVIETCKQRMPGRKAYWLVHVQRDEKTGQTRPTTRDMMETLLQIGADGASVDRPDPQMATALQRAGKELHVWTVNDPEAVPGLVDLGVSSITTDRPAVIGKAAAHRSEKGEAE